MSLIQESIHYASSYKEIDKTKFGLFEKNQLEFKEIK